MKILTKYLQYTDIPDEIFAHVRKLVLLNSDKLYILNYKALKELESTRIVVDDVIINGKDLIIRKLEPELLIIDGEIEDIRFEKDERDEEE